MDAEDNESQIIPPETLADVDQRAERISQLMRKSATLWLDIAKEVFDAKESLSADVYAIFLQKACLTPAIADKMPTIAKTPELYSDEAKKHVHRLEGWSTLYENAKLTSDERTAFFDALNKNPEIDVSRAFIQSFRTSKAGKGSTDIQIAQIKVSKNDIARLDYDQFLDLQRKLDEIARLFDRLSPAVTFTVRSRQVQDIENMIIDAATATDHDEHCDEPLPVTMPAANSDCSFSEVAI